MIKKRGALRRAPREDLRKKLALFRGLLLRALCLLRHLNPPLHVNYSRDVRHGTRRTLPPGTSGRIPAFSLRGTLPQNFDTRCGVRVIGSASTRCCESRDKKNGVPLASTPRRLVEELPLLRGLLLRALGLLRHCALLRVSDSASDEPLGRHNGWAEPSTLIPDVDYG